jgi:chromosomal replication initiator protein
MNKNRVAGSKLQIITEPRQEMFQLDLLSFVSDYALADITVKEKQARTSLVKNNIEKASAFHFHGNINKNKTFSNFCLGNTNELAVEAIRRFILNEKSDFGMIYLKASSGLGKTHILHAIANEMLLHKKTFYLNSPLMMPSLIHSSINNFNSLKVYSLLLIDDLEEIEDNNELQKTLCHLIDYAQTGKMKIILTGSRLPKDLSGCDDRFRGKLSAALVHQFFGLNNELAYDIIHEKCKAIHLNISPDVKNVVSRNQDFNVYSLESILHKLKSTSEIKNQEITLDMALQEISIKKKLYQEENFQEILKRVADTFKISVEDLISPIRRKEFALARHVAMFILKEKKGLSIMKISELFNKDHSTVIYAVARIKRQLESDLDIRNKVQFLLDEAI